MKLYKGSKRAWTWLACQIGSKSIIVMLLKTTNSSLNFVYVIAIMEIVGLVCLGLIEAEDLIKIYKNER